jgi:hypothetical protein
VSKRYEETIAELSRARLKLREELLSLPLFVTRKDDTNPEKQNFDVRIDQFRRLTDLLVERGKDLVCGRAGMPPPLFLVCFPRRGTASRREPRRARPEGKLPGRGT